MQKKNHFSLKRHDFFGQDPNSFDECGFSPLHCAADNDHLQVVKTLIEAKANLNQVMIELKALDDTNL